MLNFSGRTDEEYELIEKGDYEVILNAEWAKSKDQTQTYINCKFKIREDVEQDFGGRIIFDSIFKKKGTDEYNRSKINGLLSAIPDARLDFEDYDELIQYLNDQPMMISIDIEPANEYHQKDRNVVKYLSYRPSEIIGGTVDVTPEDGVLPF